MPKEKNIYSIFGLFLLLRMCLAGAIEETTLVPTDLLKLVTNSSTVVVKKNEIDNELFANKLFQKLKSYVLHSPGFTNFTNQDMWNLMNELKTWEDPEHLRQNFPYYFCGYDFDDQPVWVAEVGKFNIRREVERNNEKGEMLLKYAFKAIFRIIKSIYARDTPEKEIRHGGFLLDFDGFNMLQFGHTQTVVFVLRVVRDYKEVIDEFVGYCVMINVNPLAQHMLDLMRPILGRVFERIETFGTNRLKWIPMVRRRFPEYLIPVWYGGSPSFKPLKIYG